MPRHETYTARAEEEEEWLCGEGEGLWRVKEEGDKEEGLERQNEIENWGG